MSEWSNEHAWKACVAEMLPRVRIPLCPPSPQPCQQGWGDGVSGRVETPLSAAKQGLTAPFCEFAKLLIYPRSADCRDGAKCSQSTVRRSELSITPKSGGGFRNRHGRNGVESIPLCPPFFASVPEATNGKPYTQFKETKWSQFCRFFICLYACGR